MKRYFFLILAAGAAAVSCEREEAPVDVNTVEQVNLVISTIPQQEPTEDTRTTLVDWSLIRWNPQDEISVFTSVEGAKFTSTNTELAASTNFTGTISVDTAASGDAAWIWALYPYNANAVFANQTITTTLPSNQVAVAGTFDDDLLITAGRAVNPFISTGDVPLIMESTGMDATAMYLDESNGAMEANEMGLDGGLATPSSVYSNARVLRMHFEHVCAGIRFSLTKPDIESVTLTANGGEPLAGTFTFAMDNQGMPIVQSVATPSSSVTLTPPNGGTFETGVWYYFVALPVEFSRGVTFTFESETQVGSRVGQTAFTLNRGTFMRATQVDQNVEMEDQDVEVQVADPTTWTAVDELGRSVLSAENPAARENREVLLFYHTWHESRQVAIYDENGRQIGGSFNGSGVPGITDITVVLQQSGGAAENNFYHPYWASSQVCFWGRPLFDYYRTTDPWVLRKHAEMLADAGVDAVVFDCSNGNFLWSDSSDKLMEVWTQAQQDGVKVPKFVYLLNFIKCDETRDNLRILYNTLYHVNKYKNLWYYVDGKPLILAFPESLGNSDLDNDIKGFFTFRRPQADYVNGDIGTSAKPYWGWLETTTQHLFNGEEMTVGVAQNATDDWDSHCYAFNAPGSYGRSHTRAEGNDNLTSTSFTQGYNFQEQWDTALQTDPKYIFVTGWNEWIANKSRAFPLNTNGTAPAYKVDTSTNPYTYYYYTPYGIWNGTSGPPAFADLYDSERSRDIEPTHFWGDYGDVYYYQLAKNIRQYKGVAAYPNVTRKQTMEIDGNFSGWESVSPDFKHYRGNTIHRNHPNHTTNGTRYVDNTGRNDIVDARVTRDNEYIYFYVETDQTMTSYTDPAWMRLFINIDRNNATGWKGYDFCLNYLNPSSDHVGKVSRCSGPSWNWTTRDGETFDYAVNGNKMEIRVSRELLGVASGSLDFEFKWSDNMQLYDSNQNVNNNTGTAWVLDFLISGDCAPGGRFNFHYKEN